MCFYGLRYYCCYSCVFIYLFIFYLKLPNYTIHE